MYRSEKTCRLLLFVTHNFIDGKILLWPHPLVGDGPLNSKRSRYELLTFANGKAQFSWKTTSSTIANKKNNETKSILENKKQTIDYNNKQLNNAQNIDRSTKLSELTGLDSEAGLEDKVQ